MPRNPEGDVWHTAVFWHGVAMLPRLRSMTAAERMRVMHEAQEHIAQEPVWYFAGEQRYLVPSWHPEKKLSGGQVTAIIVYGLWVQVGEDELMASGLMNDWPEIKTAVLLAPKTEESNHDSSKCSGSGEPVIGKSG